MSAADPLELTSARDFLTAVSKRQHQQFGSDPQTRLHATIGRSTTVHAVVEASWLGGVQLLVPACRVGISGWRLDSLHATDVQVTCRRPACRAAASTAHLSAPRTSSTARRERVAVQEQLQLHLTA
ncbi:hypothetical protein GCM10010174_03350 [Kutzneria viridogrisea]